MALDIECPVCGETDDLTGNRNDYHVTITLRQLWPDLGPPDEPGVSHL